LRDIFAPLRETCHLPKKRKRCNLHTMPETRFHTLPDGRRIAHRFTPGKGPTLVFLPGYMSDMAGSKAQAVFDWAVAHGQACLLLDYSGCGESSGAFKDGTLSRWREEVLALVEVHCPKDDGCPVVLIGSSMGGWMMLLCALALPEERRAGLIGIAAAPDFTQWGYSEADRTKLAAGEVIYEDNAYGPEPTPTYPSLWADGQAQLLLNADIALACPVRLLHGQADPDVPHTISLRLAAALHSSDVQVTLIKDGDHRLSRPGDIALILRSVAELAGAT
jgi:pimeloyl-ACP methyl ester carboxylesterase